MKRQLFITVALLLASSLEAQETNVFIPDGGEYAPDAEAMRYMVSNALVQYGEMTATNYMGSNDLEHADSGAATNEVADTNVVAEPQDRTIHGESRSQWLDRQRARQAKAAANAQARDAGRVSAALPRDNAPTRPDYSTFRLVYERNIFDPNRVPHQVASTRPQRIARVESFSLVGTMSYDKGTFAFFDGTSDDYRKALKLSDRIAGFKITGITPDAVNLANGTNNVQLRVGMQMRSEEGGPWLASTQAQTYSDTAPSNSAIASVSAPGSSNTGSSSSTGETDVERRMRLRREQE